MAAHVSRTTYDMHAFSVMLFYEHRLSTSTSVFKDSALIVSGT